MGVFDKLKNWLTPDEKPQPEPNTPDTPEPKPGLSDYLRVWQLLKGVNFKQLWPALVSVPVIVFFTLSGILAWGFLLFGFILRMIKIGAGI